MIACWEQSRNNSKIPSPAEVERLLGIWYHTPALFEPCSYCDSKGWRPAEGNLRDPYRTTTVVCEYCEGLSHRHDEVMGWAKTVEAILNDHIPVSENVSFTFALEGVPIALREQMVRHRIGSKVGERLGCDMIPDLPDSTWWSQTMRILDMGDFDYYTPEGLDQFNITVRGKEVSAEEFYHEQMKWLKSAYRKMERAGVPLEMCRNILPQAVTHRLTWTLNLKALQHVLSKRSCWIAQLGLWEPVVVGMVEAIVKEWPVFKNIMSPPCVSGGEFVGCKVMLDSRKRVDGSEDEIPPCPIYLHQHAADADEMDKGEGGSRWFKDEDGAWTTDSAQAADRMVDMRRQFRSLWPEKVVALTVGAS